MERQLTRQGKTKEEKLTKKIFKKWRQQGGFIRFVDGNPHNCAINNLCRVSIKEAMDNIDWTVDWDMDLTEKEIKLVLNPAWRMGLIFSQNT